MNKEGDHIQRDEKVSKQLTVPHFNLPTLAIVPRDWGTAKYPSAE